MITDKCIGCKLCEKVCPKQAIKMNSKWFGFSYPEAEYWKIDNYELDQKDVYLKPGISITQCNTSRIVPWDWAEQICINSICYFGKDFKELNICQKINESYSDELFLTYNVFNFTNKKHCILGNTLICHFAFSGQKGLRERTDILQKYWNLIKK